MYLGTMRSTVTAWRLTSGLTQRPLLLLNIPRRRGAFFCPDATDAA